MKVHKSRWWRVLISISLIVYPIYVWWAVQHWQPLAALLPLIIMMFVRGLLTQEHGQGTRWFYLITALLLVCMLWWQQSEQALRYYPVWMNAGMLMLFGYSLWRPPSVITRFATVFEGPLDAKGIAYTTSVTKVWCVFFVINGSIAWFTARYASWDVWALYNGLIAYILMGLLLLIEWRVRKIVKARE